MRLSKDYAALKTAIAAMFATGGTNITEGTAWGFRLLSSKAPFADGMTSTEVAAGGRRIMIVMTDGKNSSDPVKNFHGSTFTAYGYKNDTGNRLPSFSSQPSTSDVGYAPLNARLKLVCKNARDSGIEIYTIGVSVGAANKAPLQDCASKAENAFFIENSSALTGVFEKIVGNISVPYLSN